MQDVQVSRHSSDKGKPYFLHGLRVLWLPAVSECRQDRVPGSGWQTQQKQNRLGVAHMTREKVFFSARRRMLYFFHIHNRHRPDRYDLNVPGPGSTHFKFPWRRVFVPALLFCTWMWRRMISPNRPG